MLLIYEFSFQTILNASLQSVFKAFTSPQQLSQWCAPNNLSVCQFVGKVEKNEDFRLVMQGEDGFQQSVVGTYHTVIHEHQITFSARWEDTNDHTKIAIDFAANSNQTTSLNIKHTGFKTKNDMVQQQFVWIDCLEKLSLLLLDVDDFSSRPSMHKIVYDAASNASPT